MVKKIWKSIVNLLTKVPAFKGMLRHVLTFVGGVLVSKGILSSDTLTELLGVITGGAGVVLSILSSSKEDLKAKVEGVLRHVFSFLGGVGVLKGITISNDVMLAIAEIITAVTVIWSSFSKKLLITPTDTNINVQADN